MVINPTDPQTKRIYTVEDVAPTISSGGGIVGKCKPGCAIPFVFFIRKKRIPGKTGNVDSEQKNLL